MSLSPPTRTEQMPSLEDLLVRVQRGDKHAFSLFYDALAPRILGLCVHVLRDRAIAEEVTQEVFIELWNNASQFDARQGSASSWAFRLARLRSIDRLRSWQASQQRDDREYRLDSARAHSSVEDQALTAVEHDRLSHAIVAIGEPHSTAVRLAYFGGLSSREVAETTGVAVGTAKTRIRDGLKKLKAALRSDAQEGGTR
ncbi:MULTISPECIES: sigma-70 family RNA polymerase sigma factor [Corynebacterium]|uniref:sigma-70 family RNA polymerase sigma factor n=1 Tax=Corynebacterium TaxID=1716 RepID=UPI001659C538|nr:MULTISPECIES: sigma-70 family RNA polymerase sigma factor [Corynebacterium]QNP92994.1 sigma-70 family RNA polymerase sigma factor [Corynebacterium zhongnanshanii]